MPAPQNNNSSSASAPARKSGAVVLGDAEIKLAPVLPTRLFELRVLDGCPNQTVNVPLPSTGRAATFTAYRGVPQMTPEGTFAGPVMPGNRQYLTEPEIEDIKSWVRCHVALPRPGGTGGIYPNDSHILRGARDAVPLAKFLSLTEIADAVIEAEKNEAVSMAG